MKMSILLKTLLFSDEAVFYVNGGDRIFDSILVSRQSTMDGSIQRARQTKGDGVVWCGLWKAHVLARTLLL